MQLIFPVASAAKVSIYAEVDDSKEAVSLFAAVKADQQEEIVNNLWTFSF